ncbi:hypothetical protein BAU14_07420 [Enterococcus sp. CU9D]|nr:hypothetical protein BAU14_07420 [Enterococcus sp. CU9D]
MRKYFNSNILIISVILNFLIIYFQKFNFNDLSASVTLGFPFKFLTVRKILKGDSLFNSFDIDLGGLVLSILTIYIMMYLIFDFLPRKVKSKKGN